MWNVRTGIGPMLLRLAQVCRHQVRRVGRLVRVDHSEAS
jgi:hypothetical protein